MISAWTKHLKTEEEQTRFQDSVRGSRHVLSRLTDILKEEEERISRQETDVNSFSTPNWAYLQAYYAGFRAALRLVLKILNLDQKDYITK